MRQYKHLSIEEREKIYMMRDQGMSLREIGLEISRNKSTVSRELSRNADKKLGYLPDRAESNYRQNKSKCGAKEKIFRNNSLMIYVETKLKSGWSPEQIAGRMKRDEVKPRVVHETIYRHIYSHKNWLHLELRSKRKKRLHRNERKERQSKIPELVKFSDRPEIINNRDRFGDWEGDLVIFRILRSKNITTLVERKSRYTFLALNDNKYSKTVINNIEQIIINNNQNNIFKSITYDRGSEFTEHYRLKKYGVDSYFADPHSPWQKPLVENTNARIRKFTPKKTDPETLNKQMIRDIQDKLNNTPRKILDFKTPNEVFLELQSQNHPSRCT